MRIFHKKVLVRIDPDIQFKDGFAVSSAEDEQYHYSISGTVLQVPEKLIFRKDLRKPYGPYLILAKALYEMSSSYDCDMELEIGDRVLFSYLAHFDMYLEEYDAHLVDYDMIVAKVGDTIHPLNGYLLVEMEEFDMFEDVSGFTKYNQDVNNYGVATVAFAGHPLRGYLDSDADDDDSIKVGMTIFFEKKKAIRLEKDMHNSLTDRQSSLFKMHRRDVLAFQEKKEKTDHSRQTF